MTGRLAAALGTRLVVVVGAVVVVVLAAVGLTAVAASFTGTTDNTGDAFEASAWQIAATDKFTCRNTTSFEGWCWGENSDGQLGDGTTDDRNVPIAVLGPFDTALSHPVGTDSSSCVLTDDGTVRCWGRNDKGQLGDGTTTDRSRPVAVVDTTGSGMLDAIVGLVGGTEGKFACAHDSGGAAFCWGENGKGQVGDGTTTNPRSTPRQVVGVGGSGTLSGVTEMAAGKEHACAATDSGAFCWGSNNEGQLGDGTTTDSTSPTQVKGVGGTGTLPAADEVVAGEQHACALVSGEVFCWGRNDKGQLGDGTTTGRSAPVQVKGVGGTGTLSSVSGLVAGKKFVCAVRSDTSVVCWGENNEGQLGDGTTTDRSAPVAVAGVGGTGTLSSATALAGGESHACALRSDGTAVCWGRNDKGQLGDGTTTDRETPVDVDGGAATPVGGLTDIGAGDKHTCATTTEGEVLCWGENTDGQLGDATTTDRTAPTNVVGGTSDPLDQVLTVAAGQKHACMSLMDLSIRCWGRNDKGQVGDGTTTDRTSPVAPVDTTGSGELTGVREVVAGNEHTCARRDDTTVVCWGKNDKGQLGNDGATGDTATPQQVVGVGGSGTLTDVVWLGAGGKHTCAVRSTGGVVCWGENDEGQLGDGTTTDRDVPVQVVGIGGSGTLGSVRQVDAGGKHSCAVSTAEQVTCWGKNDQGQVGDGTTTSPRTSPRQVTGTGGTGTLGNVRWVDGGTEHTCAVTLSDTAVCWGRNDKGQVGDGTTTTPRTSPRQVASTSGTGTLTEVSAVAAGSEHSCAFRRDATTAYCWGRNDKGQLGNGGGGDSSAPVVTSGP